MGYADAEIILYGTLEDSALQDWQKRRRVEFWFDGSLGYRGYIERIQPLQMEPKQTQVTLYGRYYRLGRMNLQKRYSYATVTGSSAGDVVVAGREIASIYQDLLSRF
ncbi:MAG: hypothetical protein EBR82_60705, partial [Caulobacteraceae bacterium]|nr:hypothetical protein [Caulobacteraceae bacterium]